MTTDYELAAMLRAYEGPPLALPRARPARFPVRRLLVPALAAAVVLAGATLLLRDGSPGETAREAETTLPALPPGGPDALPAGESMGMVVAISFDEAIAQADAIFVGTVSAIGGRETVDDLAVRRVRYSVERVLRGSAVEAIDLTAIDSFSNSFAAEVGTRYLVLAEETALGQGGAVALVPVGAAQGVYELVGETATSPLTGESVRIDDVARRVAADGAGR
jgi:hypothetical protein